MIGDAAGVIKPRSIKIKRGRSYPNLRLYPVLTESEEKILEKLVETGPASAYGIKKNARFTSYNLAHSGLRALEYMGLVVRLEKTPEEARLDAIFHDATLNGVLYIIQKKIISADTGVWEKKGITKIACNHKLKLPLVFGKWEYLRSRGLEETALSRLKIVADNRPNFEDGRRMFPGRSMTERIYWMFYVLPILSWNNVVGDFDDHVVGGAGFADGGLDNWKKACKEDEEIRAFMVGAFKDYKTRLESGFHLVNQTLQFMLE